MDMNEAKSHQLSPERLAEIRDEEEARFRIRLELEGEDKSEQSNSRSFVNASAFDLEGKNASTANSAPTPCDSTNFDKLSITNQDHIALTKSNNSIKSVQSTSEIPRNELFIYTAVIASSSAVGIALAQHPIYVAVAISGVILWLIFLTMKVTIARRKPVKGSYGWNLSRFYGAMGAGWLCLAWWAFSTLDAIRATGRPPVTIFLIVGIARLVTAKRPSIVSPRPA